MPLLDSHSRDMTGNEGKVNVDILQTKLLRVNGRIICRIIDNKNIC